jgi:hypothetical protein
MIQVNLDKQLDDALKMANQSANYITIPLSDLLKVRDDIAEIKRLLFRGDTKFQELSLKMGSVENEVSTMLGETSNE